MSAAPAFARIRYVVVVAENCQDAPAPVSPARRRGRGPGRPFAKGGPSANPGGRPKVAAEVRELARQHGPEAVETLVALMREGAREETRVRACEALLDRGYGRPSVAVTGEDGGPLRLLVDEGGGELLAKLRAMEAEEHTTGCLSQVAGDATAGTDSDSPAQVDPVSTTSPSRAMDGACPIP